MNKNFENWIEEDYKIAVRKQGNKCSTLIFLCSKYDQDFARVIIINSLMIKCTMKYQSLINQRKKFLQK